MRSESEIDDKMVKCKFLALKAQMQGNAVLCQRFYCYATALEFSLGKREDLEGVE